MRRQPPGPPSHPIDPRIKSILDALKAQGIEAEIISPFENDIIPNRGTSSFGRRMPDDPGPRDNAENVVPFPKGGRDALRGTNPKVVRVLKDILSQINRGTVRTVGIAMVVLNELPDGSLEPLMIHTGLQRLELIGILTDFQHDALCGDGFTAYDPDNMGPQAS